jgi:hypothetical protein
MQTMCQELVLGSMVSMKDDYLAIGTLIRIASENEFGLDLDSNTKYYVIEFPDNSIFYANAIAVLNHWSSKYDCYDYIVAETDCIDVARLSPPKCK